MWHFLTTGLRIRWIWEKKHNDLFVSVAAVIFIFGSSQLLEGSLKFEFVCRDIRNTSKDGFSVLQTSRQKTTFTWYL